MTDRPHKVLILGVTGMLGHILFKTLAADPKFIVLGTARTFDPRRFSPSEVGKLRGGFDAGNLENLLTLFTEYRPDSVVNCIGIIKQLPEASDPLISINVNALLPHRLALVSEAIGAKLIHISTDCVFSGQSGPYSEDDPVDPPDLYGSSKHLGELSNAHCVTLRTSMIGHALRGKLGLVDWFLDQKDAVRGYSRAIFSGLTTIELARVIQKIVLPMSKLTGIYHVAAQPISKYDLLVLLKSRYATRPEIAKDTEVQIDRSLDASRFKHATGYAAPAWPDLVNEMYHHYRASALYVD